MTRADVKDAIFKMAETYSGFEMICSFTDEEYVSSELPESCWSTGDYEIIGYICPECGEPIYLDDYEEFDWSLDDYEKLDWSFIISACPVCEFEFEQKKKLVVMNECLGCGYYDEDLGCKMPSIDKWYACSFYTDKDELKEIFKVK